MIVGREKAQLKACRHVTWLNKAANPGFSINQDDIGYKTMDDASTIHDAVYKFQSEIAQFANIYCSAIFIYFDSIWTM